MPLILTTTRCPDGVAATRREVTGEPLAIGRGVECGWVLPDPAKVLSKRHCLIAPRHDGWLVTDTSVNGTFLNGAALEGDLPHPLRDNDRLTLGDYEIEAQIGHAEIQDPSDAPTRFAFRSEAAGDGRLTSDPFRAEADDDLGAARASIGLPQDFDALRFDDDPAESPFPASDHVPDIHAHFRPPRPTFDLLPEDWDAEQEAPAAVANPDAAPPAPNGAVPFPSQEPEASTTPADADAFAAFLTGAGLAGAPPADLRKAFKALGAAFRAMVSGLRQSMIARATVKDEFRIGQTMIRAAGNNPLKFAADDDDALAALLGAGRRGGMSPEEAVSEALRDIRLHELATAAALQSAVRDLVAEIAPRKILNGVRESAIDGVLGRRKQLAWDIYAARHAEVLRALGDDFDSVFGRSFARAYEAALSSISMKEER